MKTILLLSDISKNERELTELAISLCSRLRCNLKLLYVYNGVPYVPVLNTISTQVRWYSELHQEHGRLLQHLTEEIRGAVYSLPKGTYHPHVSSVMLEGNLGQQAAHSAEKGQVELVIMGAGKSGALAHLLFGDCVGSVIDSSTSPVLIIPKGCRNLVENGKVVFATDFNKNDLAACAYLATAGGMLNFTTAVVHVKSKKEMDSLNSEKESHFVGRLKLMGSHTLHYRLLLGEEVFGTLEKWREISGLECLALSEHHRAFFFSAFRKNTLKGAIAASQIPLLVFPTHFEHREYFETAAE